MTLFNILIVRISDQPPFSQFGPGGDFVGEANELGNGVTRLAKGNSAAGLIWGEILGLSGYSEYTIADERVSFKLPARTSRSFRDLKGPPCTVRAGKANADQVDPNTNVTDVLVWTAFLKDHRYAHFHWPPSREDHELSSELFEKLALWLEQDQVQPNTPKIFKIFKGLDAVPGVSGISRWQYFCAQNFR